MKAKPLLNCVLVRQTSAPIEESSIYIPEKARIQPRTGSVVSIGARVSEVQAGDSILFTLEGGTEVDLDQERFLVVRESAIIGVYE